MPMWRFAGPGSGGERRRDLPIDAQLVSLGHPGLWRYSRDFVAQEPDVFVLLFDNVYSTHFGQWIEVSWASRVRVWATEETGASDEALLSASWEALVACLVLRPVCV